MMPGDAAIIAGSSTRRANESSKASVTLSPTFGYRYVCWTSKGWWKRRRVHDARKRCLSLRPPRPCSDDVRRGLFACGGGLYRMDHSHGASKGLLVVPEEQRPALVRYFHLFMPNIGDMSH